MDGMKDGAGSDQLVDVREIFRIVWRRKFLVALFLFLAQGVYLAIHLTSPRLYTTSTQFVFKDSQSALPLGGLADLVGLRTGSKSNLSDYFDVIVFTDEFLRHITERKWKIGEDSLYLRQIWDLEPPPEGPRKEYLVMRQQTGMLQAKIHRFGSERYISIEKDKRSNLVSLETKFTDGQLSYDVNKYVVDLLNDHLLNNTKSQVGENRRFVQTRLEEMSTDLRRSEEALLAYQMRNQSASSPAILMEMARLRRAVEINQTLYLEMKKQLEMARIEELKEVPVIEIISPARFPLNPDRRFNVIRWAVITWLGLVLGAVAAWILHALQGRRTGRSGATRQRAVLAGAHGG